VHTRNKLIAIPSLIIQDKPCVHMAKYSQEQTNIGIDKKKGMIHEHTWSRVGDMSTALTGRSVTYVFIRVSVLASHS
jgi:hypothetical protein